MTGTRWLVCPALYSILLVFFYSTGAEALSFYIDGSVGVGAGSTSLPSDSGTPLIGTTTLGSTVGLSFFKSRLILGATTDYRINTEFNSVPSTVSNERGNYFNLLSPTLGFKFGRFLVKLDYKLIGSYSLMNPTISGQKISYGSPSGFRGQFFFVWKPILGIGLFVDSTSFSSETIDGQDTPTSPLKHFQAGIVLSIIFDAPSQAYLKKKFGSRNGY